MKKFIALLLVNTFLFLDINSGKASQELNTANTFKPKVNINSEFEDLYLTV